MILTILALSPIVVGLVLMALPHLLPEDYSAQVRRVSRNICMGVALALLAISTWAAATSLSDIDWMSIACLLYTSPSPRDQRGSRMPSSA